MRRLKGNKSRVLLTEIEKTRCQYKFDDRIDNKPYINKME